MDQYQYFIINWSPYFIQISSLFTNILSRLSPSRTPRHLQLSSSLCFPWPQQLPCFWGRLARYFVECPPAEICLMFFSWLDWVYRFGEGFPCGSAGKESACNVGDLGFNPWVGKIPQRRERLPTPGYPLWPGEFHGLYSPWGRKESDMTEWLSLHFTSLHFMGLRRRSPEVSCHSLPIVARVQTASVFLLFLTPLSSSEKIRLIQSE